jgi:hypothetical protein
VLRGQRALQMIVGVALGIGIGTAVKAVAGPGSGAVAIGVAVLIALVAALVLGGGFLEQGVLFVNQSVSSAVLMITVAGAATGSERLLDALVGGGVALLIAVILFPVAPLPLIQDAARRVFATLRRPRPPRGTRRHGRYRRPGMDAGHWTAHPPRAGRPPAGRIGRPSGSRISRPAAGPNGPGSGEPAIRSRRCPARGHHH